MAGLSSAKKGFTLAELLIAVGILGFAISGALALYISCIFLNTGSRNLALAAGHAQFAMEEVKNTNFASIASGAWDSDTIRTVKNLQPLDNESINISVSGTAPKYITVTVNYRDRGIRQRSISLDTIITEP